ncbi:MAG: hypothetical protein FWD74_12145, partial [Actinomycetia bacterium]|nr:hypothetical protein [Actinomycetes bacterium]
MLLRRRWARLAGAWHGYGRGALVAALGAALTGALVVGLFGFAGFGSAPAGADSAVIDVTMSLSDPATQQSGSTWQYVVGVSCAGTVGLTCDGVTARVPIPADLNVPGATDPSSWTVSVTGSDDTLVPSYATIDGADWVITFERSMRTGELTLFSFYLRVPNRTTPDNTSWTLSATVSGTNVSAQSAPPTDPATAVAAASCGIGQLSPYVSVVGSTNTYSISFSGPNTSANGSLLADPTAPPGSLTVLVPPGFTHVSATAINGVAPVYDDASRLITWSPVISNNPGPSLGATVTLTAPNSVGSYTALINGQYTGIGDPSATTCSGKIDISVTVAGISGSVISKTAMGRSVYGRDNAGSSTIGTGNYARSWRDGELPAAASVSYVSSFAINLIRQTIAYPVHLYDGMPCLTNGDGTGPATPYDSLPEGSLCADPAFLVYSVSVPYSVSATILTDQVITVGFTDGSTTVVPNDVLSGSWGVPAGKTLAWLTVDGTYESTSPTASLSWTFVGFPVSSLPSTQMRYLRNTATASGPLFPNTSVFVGMRTVPYTSVLYNGPVSTTYLWYAGWNGYQSVSPWAVGGMDVSTLKVGAVTSDPAVDGQGRFAVVIPADSGINVDSVTGSAFVGGYGSTSMVSIPTAVTPDYDGLGDTLYLASGDTMPSSGLGYQVNYSGMPPGVYEYYTYSGFTDTDPSDGGATCLSGGLVTDLTGIIGPVGVPRLLCKSTNIIVVRGASGGLLVSKSIANLTAGLPFAGSPTVLPAAAGDTVQFRVRVANVGNSTLSNLTVYDVLPYAGDTGVIASQVGVSRGSTQTPVLTAVTVPSGWVVSYTDQMNPCRPEVGVSAGCATVTWASAMPATTGAIRLTVTSLSIGAYADLLLTYTVPSGAHWSLGD